VPAVGDQPRRPVRCLAHRQRLRVLLRVHLRETNQYYPSLYEGTTPVEPDKTPEEGYHVTEDLANKAIRWVRQQKSLMPDKPVFMYFAPGATHAPHHVPKEWSDKYKGQFDQGWDKCVKRRSPGRRRWASSRPTATSPGVTRRSRPGTTSRTEMKPILARQMEIYAGFLEHTDHHVGRLIDALADLEILDDTLIYYIIGDNGARPKARSRARSTRCCRSTGLDFPGDSRVPEGEHRQVRRTRSLQPLCRGWAHAMDTPYQWTKQIASHWGGTRNGTIVHWPQGIQAKGEIRSQFCHVIDVAPTVLEAAACPSRCSSTASSRSPTKG
jgi:arylsulfatase A-like enzyme